MFHQGTRLPRESSIVLCDLTENSIPCFIVTGISRIQSFILTQIRQHEGDSLSAVGARHGLQGAWSPVNLQDTVSAINVTTVCLHAITSVSQTDTAINFCSSGPSTWFGVFVQVDLFWPVIGSLVSIWSSYWLKRMLEHPTCNQR